MGKTEVDGYLFLIGSGGGGGGGGARVVGNHNLQPTQN